MSVTRSRNPSLRRSVRRSSTVRLVRVRGLGLYLLTSLLAFTMSACSMSAPQVPASMAYTQSARLPTEAKNRILQVAATALEAGEITRAQHADLVHWTGVEPCSNVRMKVPKARELVIAQAVSEVQGLPNSRVLGYFEAEGWYIVFTDASLGDEPYLVYDTDPARHAKPRASWSGAATIFETSQVRDWLLAAASGVPKPLADCFAWQVTLGHYRAGV